MKNIWLKKAGCFAAGACLSTMLLGNAYANSPTEITIRANDNEYTKIISNDQPLQLRIGETLRLDITAFDEDGIDLHNAYISSKKLGPTEIYSNQQTIKSKDEKTSNMEFKLYWFMKDNVKVFVYVKDKKGNLTKKTLDVYFE